MDSTLPVPLPDPTSAEGERALRRIVNGEHIAGLAPHSVDASLKSLVAAMQRVPHVEVSATFDHYGSGYASFVDVFVSDRPRAVPIRGGPPITIEGVSVYLSPLAPWAAWGKNEISRSVDHLGRPAGSLSFLHDHPASLSTLPAGPDWTYRWRALAGATEAAGYTLPSRDAWLRLLGFDVTIATALPCGGGGRRVFDAVFYWED